MTSDFSVGDVVVSVDDYCWEIGVVVAVDCPLKGCVHIAVEDDQDDDYFWTDQECNLIKIGVL
jgi:hypothetical protein